MGFLVPLALGAFAFNQVSQGMAARNTPQAAPTPQPMQPAQNLQQAQSVASENAATLVKRRQKAASQTNFTSPLGVTDEATTSKKILLGE